MRLSSIVSSAGLSEGDPEMLAALCGARATAVLAYCERAAPHKAVTAAVTAFAVFRRTVADAREGEVADLDSVLLSAARDAVSDLGKVSISDDRRLAAETLYATSPPKPLSPELAGQIIRALVDAAPVTALDGRRRRVQCGGAAIRHAVGRRRAAGGGAGRAAR